ncbi:DHA2 family efflux MFS transporter permease subunit [Mycobacterium shinjukuense]|uniref:MFS transporter n=1 Tax=Mycobacterium shinjukuense TaxID=398694 RepID=A0A7I7MNU7_9MYCO|nr:DHA2 family efflux MFS transporter permease subunit [Mycobacterium shinjukuense]MCV6986627.1 DHA2 family efflux MFS transporter permease subunit [Mycobacterium shinjukuense]ORB64053.1 MFS transporter [Mycobacterium shinjukuense]BBX72969.1 MFS transporter [Mycobacterium shinjukuense]
MNRTQLLTLVATGLGLFMIFLDALIVNVALPKIQERFAVGEDGLQWVVAAYSLSMAVFIMSSATLADLYGRRRWYVAGVFLFTAGSIVCGLAPSLAVLATARGVQGLGAAIVSVTSLALVSAAFPEPTQKARAIGIWTALASVGVTVGPTLGGLLVDQWGWRSVFYVNAPVGALVILLTLGFVQESRNRRARRFDLSGQTLFIVTTGTFVCAIIEGPQVGWTSPRILALFSTATVGWFLFLWCERRSSDPMMDLTLFRDASYAVSIATMCTVFFAVYGMLLLTTQFLQNVRGYTPSVTGVLILPFGLALAIVSPLVGQLVARIGARVPILVGLCLLMLGLLTLIASEHRSWSLVLAGLGLCGTGLALCLTSITTIAMTAVPQDRAGMAAGIMNAQRAIGSTIGFAVMGSFLAAWLAATLEPHLVPAVPDPVQRHVVAEVIIDSANPRAHVGAIVPARQIAHRDPVAIAEDDFLDGIRVAFLIATVSLVFVFLAGWRWFPRGVRTPDSDAERATAGTADR